MRRTVAAAAETVGAALHILFAILTGPLARRRRMHWGATRSEAEASLPGDDLIPEPRWGYTYGITIDAEPAHIWPWLVQIGQGRGGFYSHELLENLAGCRIRNVDRVVVDLQDLAIGDPIRLHPNAPALTVAVLESDRNLVLVGDPTGHEAESQGSPGNATWSFHLRDGVGGSTRLLVRGRYLHGEGTLDRLALGPALIEPIGYVMHRKMLSTIKRLAESGRGS